MSRARIWDGDILVRAWKRKPRDPDAKPLIMRTSEEKAHGLNWYLPARIVRARWNAAVNAAVNARERKGE